MVANFYTIPDIKEGFESYHKAFSIVMPEESENLISNPSPMLTLDGYTAVNSTRERSTERQKRSAYSIKVTPSSSAEAGVYYTTVSLTNGSAYAFSVDLLSAPGQIFTIYVTDNAGVQVPGSPKIEVVGREFWKRPVIVFTPTTSAVHRLYVTRKSGGSTAPFYLDGFQLEKKAYATTYLDGSMKGYLRRDGDFYWTGTPYASSSVRIRDTAAGGKEVFFENLGLHIVGVAGLDMADIENVAAPIALGGAYYDGTIYPPRPFALASVIMGNDRADLDKIKSDLVEAFRVERTVSPQPTLLRYRQTDTCGEQLSDIYEIKCHYVSGLRGNRTSDTQERLPLEFIMYDSWIYREGVSGALLNFQKIDNFSSTPTAKWIFYRDKDGSIIPFADYGAGATVYAVYKILEAGSGIVYIGGNFRDVYNANGDNIISYNPATQTYAPLGTGVSDIIRDIIEGSDGIIYACGLATTFGGVAANRIAAWNPATNSWAALGTGLSGNGYAMAWGRDGNLYVAGNFATAGGINCDGVAIWNPNTSTWSALTAGASGAARSVFCLAHSVNGDTLYIAGGFSDLYGVTATDIVAFKNGTISAIGYAGTGSIVAMAVTPNNILWVATSTKELWSYDGMNWTSHHPAGGLPSAIDGLAVVNGLLLAVGSNNIIPGFSTVISDTHFISPTGGIYAGNGVWHALDVRCVERNSAYASGLNVAYYSRRGNLYFCPANTNQHLLNMKTVVTNVSEITKPKIIVFGGMKLFSIINYTAGKALYFRESPSSTNGYLQLLWNEVLEIDLSETGFSVTSNIRGNLIGCLSSISDLDFSLVPGDNHITLSYTNTNTNETGDNLNQLIGYDFILGANETNTNNGRLYFTVVDLGASTFRTDIFKDAGRTNRVAYTENYFMGSNFKFLNQDNSSGIHGFLCAVNAPWGADNDIEVTVNIKTPIVMWRNRKLGING